MSESELYDKIESYLLGELTPEETSIFEEKMKADPEFAKEVQAGRDAIKTFRGGNPEALDELISGLKEAHPFEPRRFGTRHLLIGLMGVVALAALVIILFIGPPGDKGCNTGKLYTEAIKLKNEKLYWPDPTRRGQAPVQIPSSPLDALMQAANQKYAEGDFLACVPILEQVRDSGQHLSHTHLNLGLVCLLADQPGNALEQFKKVELEGFQQREVNWYSALAHIRLGELQEAKSRFAAFQNGDRRWLEKARQFEDCLEK